MCREADFAASGLPIASISKLEGRRYMMIVVESIDVDAVVDRKAFADAPKALVWARFRVNDPFSDVTMARVLEVDAADISSALARIGSGTLVQEVHPRISAAELNRG